MGALKVSGVCRLGADPELKFTPSGAGVCTARAIFQDRYLDKNTGQWTDGDAVWVTLVAWRQLAENMANSFSKGDEVLVLDGQLKTREWETQQGEKRTSVEVTVRDIGPSVRFNTATVQRVDRQYGGPAAGPVDDQWAAPSESRGRNQPPPQNQQRQQQGPQWQVSGQPVQRTDPYGAPPSNGGVPYDDMPPF